MENKEQNLEEKHGDIMSPPKTISKKQYDHLAKAREAKANKKAMKEHNNKFYMDQLNHIHKEIGTLNVQIGSLVENLNRNVIPSITGMKRKQMDTPTEEVEEPKPVKPKVEEKSESKDEKVQPEDTGGLIRNEFMTTIGKVVGLGAAMFMFMGYRKFQETQAHPSDYLYKNVK